MLELKNIQKDYQTGDETVHALKGINLAFRQNELVSILGQSGCGKTTLLNIIGGLDRYTSGDLIINGRSTEYFKAADWDAYRNRRIGFVFQSYNLIPHLTVLGNVELALTLSGVGKAERRERAIEALKRVGLEGQIKKRPNQMSGGQMQRVAIARAIVNNPDIILADEPTGALDSTTSVQVLDILKDIAKEKLVIMVTHNRTLAESYSTRIVSMLDGKVIDDTSPFFPDTANTDAVIAADTAETADSVDAARADDPDASDAADIKAVADKKDSVVVDDKAQTASDKQAAKARREEQKAITKSNKAAMKHTSMNLFTAFALSARNMITKKGRTIATSIAGSIGIVGVALVLALSNGFTGYINDMQTSMLASYPVSVSQVTADVESTMKGMGEISAKIEEFPDGNKLIIDTDSGMIEYHYNRINQEYVDYVDAMPSGLAIDVVKRYSQSKHIISAHTATEYGAIDTSFGSALTGNSSKMYLLMDNSEYIHSQYDIYGAYPAKANEIAVVVDSSNRISSSVMQAVGLAIPENSENATFDDLIGQELKMVYNNDWFTKDSGGYYRSFDGNSSQDKWKELYENKNNETLTVVGVMRIKESAALPLYSTGIVYTSELDKLLLQNSKTSDIVVDQLKTDTCINDAFTLSSGSTDMKFVGMPYSTIVKLINRTIAAMGITMTEEDVKMSVLQAIGASDVPAYLEFYPINFNTKTGMLNYLNGYNTDKDASGVILTLDAASIVTDTVKDMINIISYVLVAFAAISLLVSSVMIGVITYASVVERTKEIGVLRAVGARKIDIMRVFNAETMIIGLAAGVIGVLFTLIVSFPLSALFKSISDGVVTTSLVSLAWWHGLLLIGISVLLTLIAGMIPANAASKRDPVVALRSE